MAVAGFLRDRGASSLVKRDWVIDDSLALQKARKHLRTENDTSGAEMTFVSIRVSAAFQQADDLPGGFVESGPAAVSPSGVLPVASQVGRPGDCLPSGQRTWR